MSGQIPYHHPDDSQFSIAYVTQDRGNLNTSGQDSLVEEYECDERFYVLYTDTGARGTVDDIELEHDDVLDRMSAENRTICIRLLQIFEEILEEKETEEGERLDIYKQIELDTIPDALEHVEWDNAAVDVAAQLMSALVLKHAMPNANHRTAISLSGWYLESAESGFSLPTLATEEYDWRGWVDEYIRDSKRLLTVRRNTTAFRLIEDFGCDTVIRKGEIDIELNEYDLDQPHSEALRRYAQQHEELCADFMIETVQRAGHGELIRMDGPDKSGFVEYLEEKR